ncbi:MAG TPA: CHY zinc finger protein [Candidatus Sumerlaeota bacterium]|nr:CHY zinc finger protein [Candidatus Sumerlaeota bacterium]
MRVGKCEVLGVEIGARGTCAHYNSERDIVAIRFRCCGEYYGCHACHALLAGHPAERWPHFEFDRRAILCGACGEELTIHQYLSSPEACPLCHAPFNPGCRKHHQLYFEVQGGPRLGS